MEGTELFVGGIGIAENVVSTIVRQAAERVEGVVSVGGNDDIASSLISVITRSSVAPDEAIQTEVTDDKLHVTIHLAVFYGYPFTKIASDVREEVARAVREQMGVETSAVDVCIDSLVFPKE